MNTKTLLTSLTCIPLLSGCIYNYSPAKSTNFNCSVETLKTLYHEVLTEDFGATYVGEEDDAYIYSIVNNTEYSIRDAKATVQVYPLQGVKGYSELDVVIDLQTQLYFTSKARDFLTDSFNKVYEKL